MGHNYAGDNRKNRLKRKRNIENRLKQWVKLKQKNPDNCVKCDKKADYSHPLPLCTEHWAKWWVTGNKPEDKIQRKKLIHDAINASK